MLEQAMMLEQANVCDCVPGVVVVMGLSKMLNKRFAVHFKRL